MGGRDLVGLGLCCGLLAAGGAGAERPNVVAYTNREGLPQRQVLALAQDATGYLWVGTYGGLSRFDGRRFLTIGTRQGLASNGVQAIVPADGGSVWVGTSGGGVCLVSGLEARRCWRAPDELPSDDVMDMTSDGEGGVWVATFAGVTHIRADGAAVTYRSVASGEPLQDVRVVRRVSGHLLAGFASGVARLDGGRSARLPLGLPRGPVRALARAGAWLYLGGAWGVYRVPVRLEPARAEPVLPGVFVQAMAARGDEVWVGTRSGVHVVGAGPPRRLTRGSGLLSDTVHRLFFDREGVLWIGTDEGLDKLVEGPFTGFTTRDGLPHPFVRALAVDARGRLWVGTRGGVAVREGGRFRAVADPVLAGARVYWLEASPGGGMWVATSDGAALLRGGRVLRRLGPAQGLPHRSVYALALDAATGELWVGTWSGLALFADGRAVPLPPELASLRPLTLLLDGRRRLWVGLREGGVVVVDPSGSMRRLGAAQGATDQVVWSMARAPDGVWLGTNGDGALLVTPGGVERWDSTRGLVDDFVWQVLPDREGRVWFYTSQGLDRLEDGRIRHFGVGDGLLDLEGSASACVEDGEGDLWFGTGSGLVRFDPSREVRTAAPPPVLVEAVHDGEGGVVEDGARLPPHPGVLTFTVVSLTFRNERAVRFSFRLLPVQPRWSAPSRSGTVRLAGLGPGRYRFEVVAVDRRGVRSARPASFAFSVAAPWWRAPGVEVLAVLGLVGAAVGYVRWRSARLRARTRELEELVRRRTRELAEKAAELERLAATDELTGLCNRRRFLETLRAELRRLWRAPPSARLSLLLLDLDGFKDVNDSLGHAAGDAVLVAVARALTDAVRASDTVARIGGDEFAVILPMTDRAGALVVARKVVRAVREAGVVFEGGRIDVTASVGLAVVAPTAAFSEAEVTRLLQRADVALYAAKRRGGDVFLDDGETWA